MRFSQLYRQQHEAVLRLLRTRLGSEQDAADLAQEAFLRVLRYRHCGGDTLKFLLLRVALNLAVSHGRLSRVRCEIPLGNWDAAADEPSLDERLVSDELLSQVSAAVQALPECRREIFLLSRIQGVRQREIAQRYGISQRMVELHIAKAQMLIRERVGMTAAA